MPFRISNASTSAAQAAKPTTTQAPSPALSAKATAWIAANAGEGWGKKLPPIDSGNRGLAAYHLPPAQGKALLEAAKEVAPGLKALQNAKLDPAKSQLLVVLTSDDEPALHLALQDKKTGQVKYLGDVNSYDLAGADEDVGKALTKAARGAQWLNLGEGSAEPNWWK